MSLEMLLVQVQVVQEVVEGEEAPDHPIQVVGNLVPWVAMTKMLKSNPFLASPIRK